MILNVDLIKKVDLGHELGPLSPSLCGGNGPNVNKHQLENTKKKNLTS